MPLASNSGFWTGMAYWGSVINGAVWQGAWFQMSVCVRSMPIEKDIVLFEGYERWYNYSIILNFWYNARNSRAYARGGNASVAFVWKRINRLAEVARTSGTRHIRVGYGWRHSEVWQQGRIIENIARRRAGRKGSVASFAKEVGKTTSFEFGKLSFYGN